MSDLRHISHALSQYGRNGDDTLVHMSGQELQALNAMHPHGQLPRNPQTGLPEAFDLSSLLAPAAGIATAIFAPELLPFVAGAAGLGTYAATGNLSQGLMAGLGAYGAGSIGGALGIGSSAAGGSSGGLFGSLFGAAPAAADAAATGTTAMLPSAMPATSLINGALTASSAPATTALSLGADGSVGLGGSLTAPASAIAAGGDTAASSGGIGGVTSWIKNNPVAAAGGLMALSALAPNGSGNVPANTGINPTMPPLVQGPVANTATMPAGYAPGYSAEQPYFNNGSVSPGATLASGSAQAQQQAQQANAAQAAQQTLANVAYAPGGSGSGQQQAMMMLQQQQAAAMGLPSQPLPVQYAAQGGALHGNNTRPNVDTSGSSYAVRNYDTGTSLPNFGGFMGGIHTAMPRHMADGGDVAPPQIDPEMARNLIAETKAAILGQSDHPEEAIQRFTQIFGPDALHQLTVSVNGAAGPVQGAGDGTSDEVPGTIDGTQPVQLANDEHVLSADVVSGLGNGSSAAGHEALKAMSARVRAAKSNGSKMPKTIDAEAHLPA